MSNNQQEKERETNVLKNDNEFLVIIADNTQPSDYIKYLELIVPENKRLRIIEHDKIGIIPGFLIDLILFTGGEDVSPSFYNEKLGKYTSVNAKRDSLEEVVYNQFSKTPKLGICRGGQFLTVMNKGKLIQHVENHNSDHNITFIPSANKALDFENSSTTIPITSSHHQMMYPFDLNEDSYIIYGYSEYNRSPIYLNGDNKNIKIPVSFVEPEIIYYPKTKSLCIQGHPEWMNFEEKFVKATVHLTKKLFLKNEKF
jgi:GMP synthase-like glutamine amidotransferase